MTSTVPKHEIISVTVDQTELKQQCYDVRVAVFIHEQGFSLEAEFDKLDEIASHMLLRTLPSLQPVGVIRVSQGARYYKLSRLAVLKEFRQYRFGKELVLALHEYVRNDAIKRGKTGNVIIVCHSQIPVKGFYEKYGYLPEGEEFDEDGAPHQKMVATISLSN